MTSPQMNRAFALGIPSSTEASYRTVVRTRPLGAAHPGATFIILRSLMLLVALHTASATEADNVIDTDKSVMTVHVFKSGLFSAFGHEHQISAPIQQGSFSEASQSADLTVDARKLRVMDKDVSDKDRTQIQETMLGPQVLEVETYPEIRFRSSRVSRQAEAKWLVQGDLALHGQTHPIQVMVERRQGRFVGSAEIKQKDFGITPVNVAGGTVKVKNELRIEFEIVGK